ncbi:MAG TPA: hypothetical protein VJK51_05640 [Candidatus Nanoarchaeia archaeon]|nr:hypothetical protein [Candidatus Nanoarchaeia archaeon]
MGVLSSLLGMLFAHSFLVSYVAGLLGEELLLFLAVLSGQGAFSFWIVFFFGFLGVLTHDTLFYFLGKTRVIHAAGKNISTGRSGKALARFFKRFSPRHYFVPLLISKFFYGIRVGFILYLSHREQSFWRYIRYNTSATFLWFSLMLPLAWLAGRGLTAAFRVVHGIEKILSVLVVGIIVLFIVHRFIRYVVSKIFN